VAYAAKIAQRQHDPPESMVTHDWRNLFLHLVAAVVADALGRDEYNGVAGRLASEEGLGKLRLRLKSAGTLQKRYWICSFCINQHSSICSSFGRPPLEGTIEHQRWDANCRDTVTRQLHPPCQCSEPKILNDTPDLCELNKFDSMMALLSRDVVGFGQVVAVDRNFNLFSRLWCIAELVQAYVSHIPQRVLLASSSVLELDNEAAILAKIPDVHQFDAQLQALIFGDRGLMSSRLVGFDILHAAARSALRVRAAAAVAAASCSDGNRSSSDEELCHREDCHDRRGDVPWARRTRTLSVASSMLDGEQARQRTLSLASTAAEEDKECGSGRGFWRGCA